MLFKTNYFCSPVQGQLLYEGKPLAGVKVVRTLTADGLENGRYEDYAITNEEGFFEMPEVSNKTFLVRPQFFSAFPHVGQQFGAFYKDEEYAIWANTKSGFDKGGETSKPSINMVCDLSDSNKSESFNFYYTDCIVEGIKNP
jgi:hypothetical protein